MKWVWWIGGALLNIALKNPQGNDPPGMWVVLLLVLVVSTLLGQRAAKNAKRGGAAQERLRGSGGASELMRDRTSHRGTVLPYPANARITQDGKSLSFVRRHYNAVWSAWCCCRDSGRIRRSSQ